jgi:hypothetical protein
MFYLRYLCFVAHSGVQHTSSYAIALFVFILCLFCKFLWIVDILLALLFGIL